MEVAGEPLLGIFCETSLVALLVFTLYMYLLRLASGKTKLGG